MSHDIHPRASVGEAPWHGLGTQLPINSTYEEVVQAAGFYTAVERPRHSLPMEEAIPDRKGLFRGDTGEYLATVHQGYEVVQFEEVARTRVEAAGGRGAIFHTAGTLGRSGARGEVPGGSHREAASQVATPGPPGGARRRGSWSIGGTFTPS
jgi:hypothetical protein